MTPPRGPAAGGSVRAALEHLQASHPEQIQVRHDRLSVPEVGADYAGRYAGIPATSRARSEDAVLYQSVSGARMPILLGLYGAPERVRSWLPGLPSRVNTRSARQFLTRVDPETAGGAPDRDERVDLGPDGLKALPVLQTTPRDAGPYITLGLVWTGRPGWQSDALSVHRLLVLDDRRLTLWMVPGRGLRKAYDDAMSAGVRLPVTVNIGAPPAAVLASALGSRFLPPDFGKLRAAAAMAGIPMATGPARTQPVQYLAESEIVVEGYLDGTLADESLGAGIAGSLPEFLGYDGGAQRGLPVVTVTAVTARPQPIYQAVIGPGREQSVILGLAGELSVALSDPDQGSGLIQDLHFSAAGGGMLLLVVSVRKRSRAADQLLTTVAHRIFAAHPFVKLIVFTDDDVDVSCAEDVWWAVTTRSDLSTDVMTLTGYAPIGMDPSQSPQWRAARGTGAPARSVIDATTPFRLRKSTRRSFSASGGVR